MLDLNKISPILTAKFVGVVTIMVFNSACAHELFITPANNDSGIQEVNQVTPEPGSSTLVSPVSDTKTPKTKHGKHIAKHVHKAHKNKSVSIARNSRKHKIHTAAATVASAPVAPPPAPTAAIPAPEIAPPNQQIPAPMASAGVQAEVDGDSGNHIGTFVIYGLVALAILGLIYVAPRARRASKPKRKLLYNG